MAKSRRYNQRCNSCSHAPARRLQLLRWLRERINIAHRGRINEQIVIIRWKDKWFEHSCYRAVSLFIRRVRGKYSKHFSHPQTRNDHYQFGDARESDHNSQPMCMRVWDKRTPLISRTPRHLYRYIIFCNAAIALGRTHTKDTFGFALPKTGRTAATTHQSRTWSESRDARVALCSRRESNGAGARGLPAVRCCLLPRQPSLRLSALR